MMILPSTNRNITALAANGALRFTMGALFPLFTVRMYEALGIQWAGTVFAILSVVFMPVPWLLFRFGPRLRTYGVGISAVQ